MTSLQHLPEDIRAEFSVNSDGQAFASRRAIARLAGVSETAVRGLLQKVSANLAPSEIFESFAGQEFESAELIPDILVSLILEYYAYECQPRYRSEQAKQVCRSFRAIGFRLWIQRELNWEKPRPRTIPLPSSFDALEYSKKSLAAVGLETSIIESHALTMLAFKIDPQNKDIYLEAQKLIASHMELPEVLYTVTEICEKLSKTGITMKARNLNKLLCEMGLQVLSRDAKGRIQYQLTEKSQGMGKLILNSTSVGKNVPQLKWYKCVVDAIASTSQKV